MTDIVNGLLVDSGRVLMAHRTPTRRNYPGTWSFPGGHVKPGETLDQALQRELFEEIGVLARSWSFLRRFHDPSAAPVSPVSFHFFTVDKWEGDPANLGEEHTEIRWVDLDEAIGMQGLTFASYVELFLTLKSR